MLTVMVGNEVAESSECLISCRLTYALTTARICCLPEFIFRLGPSRSLLRDISNAVSHWRLRPLRKDLKHFLRCYTSRQNVKSY